jgi:hypothetical protein
VRFAASLPPPFPLRARALASFFPAPPRFVLCGGGSLSLAAFLAAILPLRGSGCSALAPPRNSALPLGFWVSRVSLLPRAFRLRYVSVALHLPECAPFSSSRKTAVKKVRNFSKVGGILPSVKP